ncbi:MAG: hypothetical protein Q7S22_07010 [Candidatus Micrarchaeota archaeon]|nr:hypothetical protein [Candidatus Micrarchaeota archaeon]
MKKYLCLVLLVFLLFGCTTNTPWGEFKVKPDSAINITVNTQNSGSNIGSNSGNTGSVDTGSSSSSSSGSSSSGTSSNSSSSSGSTSSGLYQDERNILYFEPDTNTFTVEIDGISNSNYDYVGVILKPGETPVPYNYDDVFVGDYPDSSPREVVIKSRVLLTDRSLERWRSQVANGNLQRKNFRIVIRDENGLQLAKIYYTNAWPSDYQLVATSDSFEEIVTLTAESIRIESS